jgi:uncharacterized damage-inducible protein DinB
VDRVAIDELFAFTDYSWGEHERAIRPLGDDVLRKPAPGSGWPALVDALAHINWAYIRWLANPAGTTDEPEGPVKSWDELEAYRRRVRGHAREYLDSLGDGELLTPREMNVDGEKLLYSPADIFVHVLLHERQHHGDLNTLLYQLGVEPPIVEYRFSLPESRA